MSSVVEANYRKIIQTCYESRHKRNASYSMRAFARDIGLRANRLSEVLSGKQGISPELAKPISASLGLNLNDQELFVNMVTALHARNSRDRKEAQELLKAKKALLKQVPVNMKTFDVISSWEHFAILELLRSNSSIKTSELSQRLGLSDDRVELAIERLCDVGLCKKEKNQLLPQDGFVNSPTDIPSKAIRLYHEKLIEKAQVALEEQPVEERDFASMNMMISPAQMPKLKERLKQLRREFMAEVESESQRQNLYALNIQFFSLERKN